MRGYIFIHRCFRPNNLRRNKHTQDTHTQKHTEKKNSLFSLRLIKTHKKRGKKKKTGEGRYNLDDQPTKDVAKVDTQRSRRVTLLVHTAKIKPPRPHLTVEAPPPPPFPSPSPPQNHYSITTLARLKTYLGIHHGRDVEGKKKEGLQQANSTVCVSHQRSAT